MTESEKPSRARRKVRLLLRRIGVWLDDRCLRGYDHDTHDWSAKVERLRTMKDTRKHLS